MDTPGQNLIYVVWSDVDDNDVLDRSGLCPLNPAFTGSWGCRINDGFVQVANVEIRRDKRSPAPNSRCAMAPTTLLWSWSGPAIRPKNCRSYDSRGRHINPKEYGSLAHRASLIRGYHPGHPLPCLASPVHHFPTRIP